MPRMRYKQYEIPEPYLGIWEKSLGVVAMIEFLEKDCKQNEMYKAWLTEWAKVAASADQKMSSESEALSEKWCTILGVANE